MRKFKNESLIFKVNMQKYYLVVVGLFIMSSLAGQTKVKFTAPLSIENFY